MPPPETPESPEHAASPASPVPPGPLRRAPASVSTAPMRRRRRIPVHIVLPAVVALAVAGLLIATAWRTLAPTTDVRVRPALFLQSAAPPSEAGGGAEAEAAVPSRRTVQAPGWLEADPYYVACSALADGVIEEILVLEGESVERGQVVARLVADDAILAVADAEATLQAARADLAAAEAVRVAAQTDWDNPVERRRAVGVASAALEETKAELIQLPALIAEQDAMHARLEEELKRAAAALQRDAASDIEVYILRKRAEAQAASAEALRKRRAILEAKRDRLAAELKAAERSFELRVEERRALDAAVAEVAHRTASIAQAEARRDEARLRLERMTIPAPISGFVQRRLKAPGDKVMLGMDSPHSSHILHLYDPERIQVRVDVPLADAAHVAVGQACEVIVDVLPETTFRGEVTRITHEADLQKNTLQVKVRVLDPSPLLKPEMLTRVRFLGGGDGLGAPSAPGRSAGPAPAATRVLIAPDCIDRSAAMPTVWAVRDRHGRRGIADPVLVSLGTARDDGWVPAAGPLRPGDMLVVAPVGLHAGDRVRVMGEGGAS